MMLTRFSRIIQPYQGVGAQVPNSPCTGSGARRTQATPTSQPSFGAATSNVIVTSLASPTGLQAGLLSPK